MIYLINIRKLSFVKLTLTCISPQFPKLTLNISVLGDESVAIDTTRLHSSFLLCPFTYKTPLNPFSVIWISTCTPSDKHVTTMSGLGKSVLNGGVFSKKKKKYFLLL